MSEKHCPRCDRLKAVSDFHQNRCRRDGLQSYCKPCMYAAARPARVRLQATPDYQARRRAQQNEAYRLDPTQKWASNLRGKYGIDRNDYQRMLAAQEERCAICRRHRSMFTRRFHVDHDHGSGRVRGLLCSSCNTALGQFGEDIGRVLRALRYMVDNQEWVAA